MTVTETSGVSGNVNFVNARLRHTATGAQSQPLNYGADRVISAAGTNHVNGRAFWEFGKGYCLPRRTEDPLRRWRSR